MMLGALRISDSQQWKRFWQSAICITLMLLAGCGGGGGGGGSTDISVTPKSLAFEVTPGNPSATAQVAVRFKGDGVVAGYAPGVTPPQWLSIESAGQASADSASFTVRVASNALPAGEYSSTIRFVTGRVVGGDATPTSFADMPVRMTVSNPFDIASPEMNFEAVAGQTSAAIPLSGYALTVRGEKLRWRASANQAWVTFSQTSGTSAQDIYINVNRTGVAAGTHTALISITDDNSKVTRTATVSLGVRAPRLSISASRLDFTVDGRSATGSLIKDLTISDELGGMEPSLSVNWSTSAPAPWISITPSSGTSAPARLLRVGLNAAALKQLDSGSHSAKLLVQYRTADAKDATATVDINLNLAKPIVSHVAPSVQFTNQPAEIVVRGKFLNGVTAPSLLFGTTPASSISIISETEVRAMVPTLPAGTYSVSVSTPTGIESSAADVAVIAPRRFSYAQLPIPEGHVVQLLDDPERSSLYILLLGGSILRYRYADDVWTPQAGISAASIGLSHMALSPQKNQLLVTGTDGLYTINLGQEPWQATKIATVPPDSSCGFYWAGIGILNTGKALLAGSMRTCSGMADVHLYDFSTGSFSQITGSMTSEIVSPDNGSRSYFSGFGLHYYDASSETIKTMPAGSFIAGLSRDGTRLLVDNSRALHNASGAFLGYAGAYFSELVALSPDGSRGYTLFDAAQPNSLDRGPANTVSITNLTGAPDSNRRFPLSGQVPLTLTPDSIPSYRYPLMVSTDGTALFTTAERMIIVTPLP